MKKLYPLKFTPAQRQTAWGSETLLISDSEEPSASVSEGFLAENTLADILETYLGELVGDEIFEYYNLQFPYELKIVRTEKNMPVRVHPDDTVAMERYCSYGKDAFVYVTEAIPGAVMYAGMNRNVSASEFYSACMNGTVTSLLNEFHPVKGDIFFIGAGTVHTFGAGLSFLEISQNSDIVFNLSGGNEEDCAIALEEALDFIDYEKMDESACRVSSLASGRILCREYAVDFMSLTSSLKASTEQSRSSVAYFCIEGGAVLVQGGATYGLSAGEVILIPASLDEYEISPVSDRAALLQLTVPERNPDEDSYLVEKLG